MPPQLMRGPDGQTVEVSEDDAGYYGSIGFQPFTAEQAHAENVTEAAKPVDRGLVGTINAAATGALSGLTLGLSDQVLGAISTDNQRKQILNDRRANPIVSIGAEIAGAVAPAVLTGGAITPAGAVSRLGAQVAARGAGRGAAAKVGASALGTALEGGVQAAGSYMAQAALEDKPLSADAFVGAMGKGALFGAAIGGGLTLTEKAFTKAKSMFPKAEVTREAAKKIEQEAASAVRESIADGESMQRTARQRIDDMKVEFARADLAAKKQISDLEVQRAQSRLERQQLMTERAKGRKRPGAAGDAPVAGDPPPAGGDPVPGEVPPVAPDAPMPDMPAPGTAPGAVDDLPVVVDDALQPTSLDEFADPAPTPSAVDGPSPIPTFDDLENTLNANGADFVESTIPASALKDRGWYEIDGGHLDPTRVASARQAIKEGQRDAIKLNVSPEGKIVVTDGRHRLAAAAELGADIRVKWAPGFEPAPSDVLRAGSETARAADAAAPRQRISLDLEGAAPPSAAAPGDAAAAASSPTSPVVPAREAPPLPPYSRMESNRFGRPSEGKFEVKLYREGAAEPEIRVVDRQGVEALAKEAVPPGFHNTRETHRAMTIERGLPAFDNVKDNALYIVRPSELAEADIWGNKIRPGDGESIGKAWDEGTTLQPVEIDTFPDGRYWVYDGNHRLNTASLDDRPIAVIVRKRRVDDWVGQGVGEDPTIRISDRIRARLAGDSGSHVAGVAEDAADSAVKIKRARAPIGTLDPSAPRPQPMSDEEFGGFKKEFMGSSTTEQYGAAMVYSGSDYTAINEALRKGEKLTGRLGKAVETLDDTLAMPEVQIPRNATLYRGVSGKDAQARFGNLKPGDVVEDPAFMSTSANAEAKCRNEEIVFNIAAPAGTSGIPIPSKYSSEMEVLLGRNTKLRVDSVEMVPQIPSATRYAGASSHEVLPDGRVLIRFPSGVEVKVDPIREINVSIVDDAAAASPPTAIGDKVTQETLAKAAEEATDAADQAIATQNPAAAKILDAARKERMTREEVRAWISGRRAEGAKNEAERGYRVSYESSLTGARGPGGAPRKMDRVTTMVDETPEATAARKKFTDRYASEPTLAELILAGRPPKNAAALSADEVIDTSRLQAADRGYILDDEIETMLRDKLGDRGIPASPRMRKIDADDDLGSAGVGDGVTAPPAGATRAVTPTAEEEALSLANRKALREAEEIVGGTGAPPAAAAAEREVVERSIDDQIESVLSKPPADGLPVTDDIAVGAKLIAAHEEASAELAEALGAAAPKTATDRATALRGATAARAGDTAANAAQVAETLTTQVAPEVARKTGTTATRAALGKLGDVGAGLEVLKAMGISVPDPASIPVIGPVLSLYLKARAAMGVFKRMGGKVPETAETKIASKASSTRDRATAAVQQMLEGGAKATRKLAPAGGPLAALGYKLFTGGGDEKRQRKTPGAPAKVDNPVRAYEQRMEELARAMQPGAIRRAVQDRVRTSDPELLNQIVATTERKLKLINDKAPRPPLVPTLLKGDGVWRPSSQRLQEWARYIEAAEDPATVLEDVAAGRGVSIEAAETLRTVYPALYQMARMKLVTSARDLQVSVPYQRRVSLSVLFKVPVDPSMNPSHIQFLAQNSAVPPTPGSGAPGAAPAQPPAMGAPPVPSISAPVTLGDSTMTALDRRSQR